MVLGIDFPEERLQTIGSGIALFGLGAATTAVSNSFEGDAANVGTGVGILGMVGGGVTVVSGFTGPNGSDPSDIPGGVSNVKKNTEIQLTELCSQTQIGLETNCEPANDGVQVLLEGTDDPLVINARTVYTLDQPVNVVIEFQGQKLDNTREFSYITSKTLQPGENTVDAAIGTTDQDLGRWDLDIVVWTADPRSNPAADVLARGNVDDVKLAKRIVL